MPYIDDRLRERYDEHINELHVLLQRNGNTGGLLWDVHPGHLNYVISRLLWSLLRDNRSYERANSLLGVLEAVKLELYRRLVVPYEDEAIARNGDIKECPTVGYGVIPDFSLPVP